MHVVVKRVYEDPTTKDGYRVLVDKLWPRGVSKAKARLDLWLKDVAPSTELRQWFNHDPARFDEFSARYQTELDKNPAVAELSKIVKEHKTVTLLYGAKDPKINHATVLKKYLTS
jgi:uncharacterized protein YeaO (DUF488 family)